MSRLLAWMAPLLLLVVLAAPARADQVAYVQDGQVWVSSLDGAVKRQLTGATLPAGRVFSEVAQGDGGTIFAVAREPGKISQLNTTAWWDPSGALAGQGQLTYKRPNGEEPSTVAMPVSLDVTPDGRTVVYGFSAGFGVPASRFRFGTYARAIDSNLEPVELLGVWSGTLAGNRLVAVENGGRQVDVQDVDAGNPFGMAFTGWVDIGAGDVERADVAATGTVAGFQLKNGPFEDSIAMVPFAGLGAPAPTDGSDCFLPAQGKASHLTISRDARSIAWQDDRGVVSAGVPVWFASTDVTTCNLSSPPVVISATGSHPSMGGSVAAVAPSPGPSTPGGTTPPGTPSPSPSATPSPSPSSTPAATKPKVALAAGIKASAFKRGVAVKVTVRAAGTISVALKQGTRTIAKTSRKAGRAGTYALKLKSRKRLRRGAKVKLVVTAGGRTTTLVRTLR